MNKGKSKPPAHEVILTRLAAIHQTLESSLKRLGPGGEFLTSQEQLLRSVCGELLTILATMHLPERELPKILAALRKLKVDVIGLHRGHIRLLKGLSKHDPLAELVK